MTVYEIMKALKYQKFSFNNKQGEDITIEEYDFDELKQAIEYGETDEEKLLDELSEKRVLNINMELNIITVED